MKTADSFIASEVATRVASAVLIRLGVSTGILATGAANSWWSFGGALVIGVVVDLTWDCMDNPEGNITREMNSALDRLASQGSSAITDEMTEVVSQRSGVWTKTIGGIVP